MKLVFLFGNCAVGKMTVGQALCDITRLKLFHNHMTSSRSLRCSAIINRALSRGCGM